MNTRKTALITGSSYGIGRELAYQFIKDGYDLVITARSEDKLKEVKEEFLKKFPNQSITIISMDLSLPKAPFILVEELKSKSLSVNVLVNNAGYGLLNSFHNADIDRQLNMIQLNVNNLVSLTRLLLPQMIKNKEGGILNVASVAGFVPGPNMAVYYATKAFVLSFSEALHEELKLHGITVSCLAPGPTKTKFGEVSGMEASIIFKIGAQSPHSVARKAYQGFKRNKAIILPGINNKFITLITRLFPRSVIRKVINKIQKQ